MMFEGSDSDSEPEEQSVPVPINQPEAANHIVSESFTVETSDHGDHRFCGVMFDVCSVGADEEEGIPITFLQINSLSVRGDLGHITVWASPGGFRGHEHKKDHWEMVYEKSHAPSRMNFQCLQLDRPIHILPGETCGMYVHSKLGGDGSIAYDNQRDRVTYQDSLLRVLPGLARLNNKPFGRRSMWDTAWRDNREFVGRISYGVAYVPWNPVRELHWRFPPEFRNMVWCLLLCTRRKESPFYWLPDEVVFHMLNMCKHDWFSLRSLPLTASDPGATGLPRGRRWRVGGPEFGESKSDDDGDDDDSSDDEGNVLLGPEVGGVLHHRLAALKLKLDQGDEDNGDEVTQRRDRQETDTL